MINLYSAKTTTFESNGLATLDDIVISAKVTQNISGIFVFEGIFLNVEKANRICNGMIIKTPTPRGPRCFRISEIRPKKKQVKIMARALAYDLDDNFIEDTNVVGKNGQAALNQILAACKYPHNFTAKSDISVINNSRLVSKNVKSEAILGDEDNSFINRWGGEVDYNNWEITINSRIGADRGFKLLYGKNIKDYDISIDESQVVTVIEPHGYNGLMIPERYVISPLVDNYATVKVKRIDFSEVKVLDENSGPDDVGFSTEAEAFEELRRLSKLKFSADEIDKPKISADIDMIELSKTTDYVGKEFLERLFLGDTLTLEIEKLNNLNVDIRLISYEYDCIKLRYSLLELGQVKDTLFTSMGAISGELDNVIEIVGNSDWSAILDKAINEATKLMEEGIKNSYVIHRKNEIIIGDAPSISAMVNCIVINRNGIGYSNNGYHPDKLISAWTIDGKFNASCILTGELLANLIKVGVLSSANMKTWINMEDGTFNFADKITFDGSAFKITLSNGKSVEETVKENNDLLIGKISDVDKRIDGILGDFDGAISDGIINEAEAKMIEDLLKNFEREKESLSKEYVKIKASENLTEAQRTTLTTAWTNYSYAYNDLVGIMTTIITDGKVTDAEKLSYNEKVIAYNPKFAALREALVEAQRLASIGYTNVQFEILDKEIKTKVTAGEAASIATQSAEGFFNTVKNQYATKEDLTNLNIDELFADIQEQLDGKIQTYYQATDPATYWNTDAIKASHVGDLWYNTVTYETKRYVTGYTWKKLENDEAKAAAILAGAKATIFTAKPSKYNKNDLWILESDTVHPPNKTGEILICKTTATTYSASHWVEGLMYTNDDYAKSVESNINQRADNIELNVKSLEEVAGSYILPIGTAMKSANWSKDAGIMVSQSVGYLNIYSSSAIISTSGEFGARIEVDCEASTSYYFYLNFAPYSTSKKIYRFRLQQLQDNAWSTIQEFTGESTATKTKMEELKYKFTSGGSARKLRLWIGRSGLDPFDIWVSNISICKGGIFARESSINLLEDKIQLKVEAGDLGTLIEQNSEAVKIAWNNNSKYVQFETGGLAIYDGSVSTSKKRAYFDEDGNHFWRDGYYLGKIGTNNYTGNTSLRGIVFDLEPNGAYMTWAVKKASTDTTYTMMWTYNNKTTGIYTAGRLHAGADIDMHNYYLRNVNFEGGGITGTLKFVQITSMSSNGTAAYWYNNSILKFQNGILVDATWGS